jgi:hypothetical protein
MEDSERRFKQLRVDCRAIKKHIVQKGSEQAIAGLGHRIRINALHITKDLIWCEPVYNELKVICELVNGRRLLKNCLAAILIGKVAATINSKVIDDVCEALRQM